MFETSEAEKSLLIIDENPQTGKILADFFGTKYICDKAISVESSLGKIRARHYCVIVCDVRAASLNAPETVACFQSRFPASIVILIGEKPSAEEIIKIFRAGVFDFICQPFKLSEIDRAVKKAFENYGSKVLNNDYQTRLEKRAAELDKALEEIENSYRLTLKALVQALEMRDFETRGHSERAVTFSLRLGYELGLDKIALRNLELGALVHDIGKIGVPDQVLQKPASLNDEERRKMQMHTLYGQRILRNIPFLEEAEKIAAQHHEKWDGSGYPSGLRGEEIDFGARIFAVVDAFDAMISDRVYRAGRSFQAALEELERCAGTQFDPSVVEAFRRVPKEDWEILHRRSLAERQEILSLQSIVAELACSKQTVEMVH